jgi:hypothetical protein
MIARRSGRFPTHTGLAFRRAFALIPGVLLLAAGCDKVPLMAPTGSTISLFARDMVLPVQGTTEIVATVIEQGGTPVHNGTLVTFTSTLGRIEPQEARTENGKVNVRLIAGDQSGVARINAFSGGASAEAPLEIRVGGAAAERLLLNISPGTVPAGGGTVQVVATVTDASGNRLPGVPVTFTSTAGTVTPATAVTDQTGEARATLTTNRETTVTATAGAQQQTVTVRVNVPPNVSISVETATPAANQPVAFSVTANVAPNGAPVQNVTVDFGDGTVRSLGSLTGTTRVTHTYRASGTFVVTATATDTGGDRISVSTTVAVARAAPLAVNITASPPNPAVQTPVTFTASVTPLTVPIERYEWNFGDGEVRVTTGNQTSKIYGSAGHRLVTVRVVAIDGTNGQGSIDILVQP